MLENRCRYSETTGLKLPKELQTENNTFVIAEHAFARSGILLHLDCMTADGQTPEKQILLIHGVTHSSHVFDVDYQDYSLVRFLAREGYAVWRLDISGFGRSGKVSDGFLPDSEYAAEDIRAAVEKIIRISGQEQVDVLGWSWGTVTTGRYAAKYPEHLDRLVLYAPILTGIGECEVKEAFHHNEWEDASEDFQRDGSGRLDETITDPAVIGIFCSNCWRYDGESSPNGGRRDICVNASETLIDLSALPVPTLILCGDKDPYLNMERIRTAQTQMPAGSETRVLPGGAHALMYEKPYYHEFQKELIAFLRKE